MDPLLEAVGASVHPWTMGGRCCGAANMNTKPETAFVLVNDILHAARGADVIVTVCPMCQMNLEGYQAAISERFGENRRIPVLYLPQLIGAALGIPLDDLKLRMNLSVSKTFLERMKRISESRSIPPSPVERKGPEKQPAPIS
jgi:heterodisulfide reductase subunit B